jgi:lipopolysaccharide transport system permease protein
MARSSPRPTRIEPPGGLSFPDPRELWSWRELFFFIAWRDVKVRYKQAVLGALWAIIKPVALMIVFTLFFGIIFATPSSGVPRPVFIFSGVLLWVFLAETVSSASNSLLKDRHILEKLYFPRVILPLAALVSPLVDYAFGLLALAVMMIFYGVPFIWTALLVPVFVALVLFLATAVGVWFSALNLQFTDFRHITPLVIQVWFYSTPIFYPVSVIPDAWQAYYRANPMVGIVEGMRWALFGTEPPNVRTMVMALLPFLLVLLGGVFYFSRHESSFAENL